MRSFPSCLEPIFSLAQIVYAMDSGERRQLGNGRTGEYIVASGRTVFRQAGYVVPFPDMQKSGLRSIRTGALCVLCLPSTPSLPSARTRIYPHRRYVHVWGSTGCCRLGLGLGNQQDTRIPKLVPAFLGDREIPCGASVYTGPTCSAVIDQSGGKWKIW